LPRKKGVNGSGTIRKKIIKKNGKEYLYYEARFTVPGMEGKQYQRSIYGKTEKEVAKKLREMTCKVDNGEFFSPKNKDTTVKIWLEVWGKDYTLDLKNNTRHEYMQQCKYYLIPAFGDIKLSNLTTHTIQLYYNSLVNPAEGKPLSGKTVKNLHGTFSKALNKAVELGMIGKNPCSAVTLPRVERKEKPEFSVDTVKAVMASFKGHKHELIYEIDIYTGLRESEILGLTWDCIDFERAVLTVKQELIRDRSTGVYEIKRYTKTGKKRIVGIPPTVVELFRKQRKKVEEMKNYVGSIWEDRNLVFPNEIGGFLSYRTVYDCYKKLVKNAGFPNLTFHNLRNAFADISIISGDDPKTLQSNLGHSTAKLSLEVYSNINDDLRREHAQRLENFIKTRL